MLIFKKDGWDHGCPHQPGSGEGHGDHKMYFHFSKHVTILFSFWTTSNIGVYLASLVAVFVLAIFNQLLNMLVRKKYELKYEELHET